LQNLCLRGFDVALIEKKDLNAGASGGKHGLLHSDNSVALYFQPVVRSFADPPLKYHYPMAEYIRARKFPNSKYKHKLVSWLRLRPIMQVSEDHIEMVQPSII